MSFNFVHFATDAAGRRRREVGCGAWGMGRQRNVLAQDNTNFAYDSYYKCFLSAFLAVVLRQNEQRSKQRWQQKPLPLCAYPSNEKLLLRLFSSLNAAVLLIDALRIDCRSNNNNQQQQPTTTIDNNNSKKTNTNTSKPKAH